MIADRDFVHFERNKKTNAYPNKVSRSYTSRQGVIGFYILCKYLVDEIKLLVVDRQAVEGELVPDLELILGVGDLGVGDTTGYKSEEREDEEGAK